MISTQDVANDIIVNERKNMTDPQVPTAEGETAETSEQTAAKGRPRPDSTVQRDAHAEAAFQEAGTTGLTREALAEKLTEKIGTEVKASEAYLSIYRLSRQDPPKIAKVRHEGKVVWMLTEYSPVVAVETTPVPGEGELAPASQL